MPEESRDASAGEQRRLAAIVFTDVVSYSARMGRDEASTMALVKVDFAFMRELCERHRGEVLNTMGDGMLMCFPSAVEAVATALEIQKQFGLRTEAEPPEKALQHRIGIHVGDVVFQDGNVSGDGVNIAARLESKAPYGGICVSQIVRDTVKGKLDMWAVYLGEQKFKNIAEPIAVYTIAPPGSGLESRPATPPPTRELATQLRWRLAAVVAVLVLGGYFALRHNPAAPAPAAISRAAPAPVAPAPEKPVPSTPARKLAEQAQALARKPSFTREELSLAGDLTSKACELEPELAFAWGTRAEVSASYVYRGWDTEGRRARDAETWARRAMALDAREPGALFALGVISRSQGVFKNAERLLQQAIETTPDYGRFRLELAQVFSDQGQLEHARSIIREAIDRNPRDQLAHYNLAMTYANYNGGSGASTENRKNAIRELDAALALGPMANALLLKAGIIGSWDGDVKRMRELLDTLTPEQRTDDRAVYWALRCGLLERNAEHILSAAALTAQDYIDDVQGPKAWFVALAHGLAGREELARSQWKAAETVMRERLQRNPENQRDRVTLITTMAWQGREEEVTRELAALEPRIREQLTPWTAHWLARVYAGLGDAGHAVPYLRRALNQMIFVTDKTVPLDPWWDRLRGQPEFEALLAEIGAAPSAPRPARVATTPPPPETKSAPVAAKPVAVESAQKPPPTAAPDAKSIAVLPFANLSSDPANAFFADGVHEDVITNLAKIHDLRVISRTSVMGYRDTRKSIREIAAELGVAKLLEGSVRRAGNHARITAQLIDARTDEHVWAETYDRDLNDVFAVQSEIARKIAGTLQATLTDAEKNLIETRPTTNQKAYDLYVKAREAGPFRDWINLLVQAVAEDPNFALAQAELSRAYAHSYWSTQAGDQTADSLARSKAALDIAIRLAPDAPETHFAIGDYYYRTTRDWERAWQELRLVETKIPNDSALMQQLAYTARRTGRWNEAMDYFDRARRLDPLERGARFTYPLETLATLRRFGEARNLAAEAVSSFNDFPWFNWVRISLDYELDGDRPAFERSMAVLPGGKMSELMSGSLVRERLCQAIRFGDRETIDRLLNDPSRQFINSEQSIVNDPVSLHRAALAFLEGKTDDAVREANAAIAYYRAGEWKPRQEVWVLLGLARAESYAGRADEAMHDAGEALARSVKEDAWDAVFIRPEVGRVYAALGRRDEALAVLRDMMTKPSGMTPRQVRDDPFWSRLKDDPRFEEILQSAKPL